MTDDLKIQLTAEEFLTASDVVIERVETHEIKPGSFIYVRSLTAANRGRIDASAARFKQSNGKNSEEVQDFNVNLVFWGACDEKGERLFTDIKHVAQLKKRNAALISRIAEVVGRLSGLSKEDLEKIEKNSLEIQPEDSPSV